MFESLFGAEMPLAVRFFIAFLIVLGLIGAAAWAVRRFGGGRLGTVGTRGRQPRLAVIDQAPVDARRRLVLIRRDNVEHLLMIGGPSDLIVEPNIVRAVAAPREMPAPRGPGLAESLPRAVPLPEGGNWPLQPEPAPAPRPAARTAHPAAEDNIAWPLQPHSEPAPQRSQRDTLTSLADEIAARPAPTRDHPPARTRAVEPRIPPAAQPAAEAPSDQGTFDMAHRLESAMRRPPAPVEARVQSPAPRPAPAQAAAEPPAEATPGAAPEPPARAPRPAADTKPARPDAKPAAGKSMYESLEQEMASLLGRPASKT
jgi:hypothetical protein